MEPMTNAISVKTKVARIANGEMNANGNTKANVNRVMNTNVSTKVNLWENTLKNKESSLSNLFNLNILFAFIVFGSVFLMSKFTDRDGLIVTLLVLNIIGCYPYIEVAQVQSSNSLFARGVSTSSWRAAFKNTNDRYNVLSSNVHINQTVFPILTFMSCFLFLVHKVFGDEYVTFNTVVIIQLIQLPFNSFLGMNPLGIYMTRQNVSKHITQNELRRHLNRLDKLMRRNQNQPARVSASSQGTSPLTK